MSSPTLSSIFQIGIDNALIQVPQNYLVPTNPPSPHNPPNSGEVPNPNGATKDSVTLYVSAIQGFNNPLSISFFIRKIDQRVGGTALPVTDRTTTPADGAPLSIEIGTDAVSTNLQTGIWDGTNFGWKNTIIGPDDVHQLVMTPNINNALNTYVATNYRTLFINPQGTGGTINPQHPPSYQINIYAYDPITNTYASCSFTLVVLPSIQYYGLGTFLTDAHGNPLYVNNGTLTIMYGKFLNMYIQYYPLEATTPLTNPAQINTTLTVDGILLDGNVADYPPNTVIDGVNSSYGGTAFENFATFDSGGPGAWSRVPIIGGTLVHLVIKNSSSLVGRKGLVEITGTDTNGVTTSAYIVVTVSSL